MGIGAMHLKFMQQQTQQKSGIKVLNQENYDKLISELQGQNRKFYLSDRNNISMLIAALSADENFKADDIIPMYEKTMNKLGNDKSKVSDFLSLLHKPMSEFVDKIKLTTEDYEHLLDVYSNQYASLDDTARINGFKKYVTNFIKEKASGDGNSKGKTTLNRNDSNVRNSYINKLKGNADSNSKGRQVEDYPGLEIINAQDVLASSNKTNLIIKRNFK